MIKKIFHSRSLFTMIIVSIFMVMVGFLVLSCQESADSSPETGEETNMGVEYPLTGNVVIFTKNIHILHENDPGWFDLEGLGDPVDFGGASFYYLPRDIKEYEKYHELLTRKDKSELNILTFTIGEDMGIHILGAKPIIRVEIPSEELLEKVKKSYEPEEVGETRSTKSLNSSMTLSQATSFFNQFKNMSCNLILSNPCIPFQFAADGCYARAHYMRKLMADAGYDCEKIFLESNNPTTRPLQANTNANCCQAWSYHVAPLVTTPSGKRVIDPSLCSAPVTISTWVNKMLTTCYGYSVCNSYTQTVKPSNVYIYRISGSTSYDNSYVDTYDVMDNYSLLSGCY